MDGEVLLADGVERREQGYQERGVANGEQACPGAVAGVEMPPL